MARSFFSYVSAAFSARPAGMFIAPNWVGLGAIAIASFIQPGIALIGAGLELGYLLALASNKRFQRLVDARAVGVTDNRDRLRVMLQSLIPPDQRRYRDLEERCRNVLQKQVSQGADVAAQDDALSRLALVYLQLLVTRQTLAQSFADDEDIALRRRQDGIKRQLQDANLIAELRNSLEGQAEILQHRLESHQEARTKLQFIDAELVRIQEQVELVREQSALTDDPSGMAQRIDSITGSLTQTGDWIRRQQEVLGRLDDISTEPPSLLKQPA